MLELGTNLLTLCLSNTGYCKYWLMCTSNCLGVCTFIQLCTYWDNTIDFTCHRECAHLMVNIHLNSIGNELRVVHKKYSDPVFGCVDFLRPTNLPVEDNCSSSSHTIISISDSIDSCTQERKLKTSIQLKSRKPRTQSLAAMLATQSEVCLNT